MKGVLQKQRKKYLVDELLSDDTKFKEWANLVIQSIQERRNSRTN